MAKRCNGIWKGAKTVFFGRYSRVHGLLTTVLNNPKLLEQEEVYNIGDKLNELLKLVESLVAKEALSTVLTHCRGKYIRAERATELLLHGASRNPYETF